LVAKSDLAVTTAAILKSNVLVRAGTLALSVRIAVYVDATAGAEANSSGLEPSSAFVTASL